MKSILDTRPALTAEIMKVAEVAGYLWEKGWAERNGGNITINVTNEVGCGCSLPDKALAGPFEIGETLPNLKGCWFYCKGTNRRMRDLARDPMANGSVIKITDDCAHYYIVADAVVPPTSEMPSHLAVHNYLIGKGSSYKACVHTHPTELVAMSHTAAFLQKDVLTKLLWSMIPETRAFCPRGLGIVPYMLPGSKALAAATIAAIDEDYDVVLWEKHGVFAIGEDVIEAFDMVDTLNKSALIYRDARAMGFTPDGMSEAQMAELARAFNLPK